MYSFPNWMLPEWAGPGRLRKQLIQYFLKKALGSFIKSDFALETLELEVSKGQLSLKQLDLKIEFINSLLAGAPLQLQAGSIDSIHITVPWQSLLTEASHIKIDGLKLDILLKALPVQKETESQTPFAEASAWSFDGFISEFHETCEDIEKPRDTSPEPESPQAVTGLVETILRSLKLTVTNLKIHIVSPCSSGPTLNVESSKVTLSEDHPIDSNPAWKQHTFVRIMKVQNFNAKCDGEVVLNSIGESKLNISYQSDPADMPSLILQLNLPGVEATITPQSFKSILKFMTLLPEPTRNSPPPALELSWKVTADVKRLRLIFIYIYQPGGQLLDHSHLRISLDDLYTAAEATKAELQVRGFSVDEWLSPTQFPPSSIPKGGFSFPRSRYLPVLLFDEKLPGSSELFDQLGLLGDQGTPIPLPHGTRFSGLSTYWSRATPTPTKSENVPLKLDLSLGIKNKVKLVASPGWVRFDPRMIDRLEGFLGLIAQATESPNTHGEERVFNEALIMNDLDARGNASSPQQMGGWVISADTRFLRLVIQGPCGILAGECSEVNHLAGRTYPHSWVMDIQNPWLTFPGPAPCLESHLKIGYAGLDIIQYSAVQKLASGFLRISPSPDSGGQGPTLEIGRTLPSASPPPPHQAPGPLPVPFPPGFSGFSEGEVRAADPTEQEEEMLGFRHHTLQTSQFTIHCNFPHVELKFTKEIYDRIQFLINDITSWEPRFLATVLPLPPVLPAPSSPQESEAGFSFYTARDDHELPSTIHPDHNTASRNDASFSLSSLVVSMPWLDIYLETDEKNYGIGFNECRFFSTSKLHGKTQTYTHVEAEDLYLLDLTQSPIALLAPAPFKLQNNSCFSLHLFSSIEPPLISIKELYAALNLTALDLRLPLSLGSPPSLFQDMAFFFSGDPKTNTISTTTIRANVSTALKDISIVLIPDTTLFSEQAWLTVLVERAGASGTLFPPSPVTLGRGGIDSALIFLSEKSPEIVPPILQRMCIDPQPPRSHDPSPATQYWKSHLFAQVGALDCISTDIRIQTHGTDPTLHIDIINDRIFMDICQDSLTVLQGLLRSIMNIDNDLVDKPKSTPASNKRMGTLEQSIHYNILDTLEEDAYGSPKHLTIQPKASEAPEMDFIDEFFGEESIDPELEPPASLTYTPQSKNRKYEGYFRASPEMARLESRDTDTEGDSIKILSSSPLELLENHFAPEAQGSKGALGSGIDEARLQLNIQVNVTVRLYDGQDWKQIATEAQSASPKATSLLLIRHCTRLARPPRPSLELNIEGLEIALSVLYPSVSHPESLKLVISVHDVELLDLLPTSTWRKFLSAMDPPLDQLPRESQSNVLQVELTQICPSDPGGAEYRLKISLLPLRLFVDQDALNFLVDFFIPDGDPMLPKEDDESNNEEQVENKDLMFFQYAEISPIVVKIDYKPKHFNLRQLSEGNYVELANVFHLEDAQITFDAIKLMGVNGLNRLIDELLRQWLPHLTGTQLPRVVSGVGPIRSLVNIGSGVADLVLLPIQQYRKDGRIARGVARGATSFARATTSEAVKVGASLVMGAQVILEQADSLLRPKSFSAAASSSLKEETVSRYANQPGNINEGVEFAYNSLRRNLDVAARTVLAIPVEISERHGTQGTTRAVIRAIPIAVLQPMIGATQALSMALLGLRNSLDPHRHERLHDKYKGPK